MTAALSFGLVLHLQQENALSILVFESVVYSLLEVVFFHFFVSAVAVSAAV